MDERLQLGWRGFEQAERQLREGIQNNEDPLVPLGHLMQWAYAIDQWYETRILDGKKEIEQLSKVDTAGETYNGFRAARNRVAHDLSLVADLGLDISRTVRRDPLTCSDGAHSLHHLVMPLDDMTVASSQLSGEPNNF